MAEFSKICQDYYGIERKLITTTNPQSNAIIELIHQTIGNTTQTFDMYNIVNNDPYSGILATTMFTVRATYNTTLQAYPVQLVFRQYSILNIKHVANWEHIWQSKQLVINNNNKRKDMRRNNHQYKVGDKIIVKH